jgi:hypothetical protein
MPGMPGGRGNLATVDLDCGEETSADLQEGVPCHKEDAIREAICNKSSVRRYMKC